MLVYIKSWLFIFKKKNRNFFNAYQKQLAIVKEYAPQLITDESEIEKMINYICACNGMIATSGQKNWIMKLVMPVLKKQNVDMKIANNVLNNLLKKNDAIHGKA